MGSRQIRDFCRLSETVRTLLRGAIGQLNLSARAYDRILKVSRTIADLAGEEEISGAHVGEAIQYRSLDRKYWS
jgi:magnesium chelatase family protein